MPWLAHKPFADQELPRNLMIPFRNYETLSIYALCKTHVNLHTRLQRHYLSKILNFSCPPQKYSKYHKKYYQEH